MEEKKNSAVIKTENIANEGVNSKNKSSKNRASSETEREKTAEKNKNKKLSKRKERQKMKNRRLKAREERKKAMLEKREERKRLIESRKKAREERRQKFKELKLQKREERIKRREQFKNESKQERAKRLQAERDKKLQIRREKLADKKQKRAEVIKEKRQKREEKARLRRERSSKGYGGWLAAVISLGCAVLVLGGLLTFTLFTPMDDYMSLYNKDKSFYDLVGYVDAIDVNLSKIIVSNDDENRQKLLGEVRVQSNLGVESLSSLALQDEDKYYTTKFINQVGDFAKYLNEKLIDGEKLSAEDLATLQDMYEINSQLRRNLSELLLEMGDDYDFKTLYEYKDGDVIISKFKELESNAVNYPHMIYDGAFSDGTEASVAKYIENMQEVTKAEAQEFMSKYFAPYGIKDIELVGETTGVVIETYNFEATDKDGVMISAQITKKGGKLAEFNYFKDCSSDLTSVEKCREIADEFLEKVGYKSVKAVWTANSGNVITINYASVFNGVICYSDLIKVNVCRERGVVNGLEASSYIYNYQERKISKAQISLSDAKQKVKGEIEIESSRLAIIPKGESNEVLAYEFTGKAQGSTYYIYIDASTGKEVDIFKVIDTTEGTLLM